MPNLQRARGQEYTSAECSSCSCRRCTNNAAKVKHAFFPLLKPSTSFEVQRTKLRQTQNSLYSMPRIQRKAVGPVGGERRNTSWQRAGEKKRSTDRRSQQKKKRGRDRLIQTSQGRRRARVNGSNRLAFTGSQGWRTDIRVCCVEKPARKLFLISTTLSESTGLFLSLNGVDTVVAEKSTCQSEKTNARKREERNRKRERAKNAHSNSTCRLNISFQSWIVRKR